MDPVTACPRCGAARPANAPAGLCPRCLLGHGLRAGRAGGPDEDGGRPGRPAGNGAAPFGGQHPPRPSGVLSTLGEVLGPVPRVLLRDAPAGEERPARTASEEMPAAVGDAGRYQLYGEIARGGMGVVLKGRDVDLGRDVAVKVLLERHLDNPEVVRRFVEEAQIGGQLQHPGVLPVYELGRFPDGRLYIAMKLIRGRTLAELLEGRADPAADRGQHLPAFEQVCQAVAYAHACGVVHRDLKPSNVMVGGFGEVFVMDWGLAKVLDRGYRRRGAVAPGAGAPEPRSAPYAPARRPTSRGPTRCWAPPPTWPRTGAGPAGHAGRAGGRLRPRRDPVRDPDRPAPTLRRAATRSTAKPRGRT
ncbi:MAG: serine/threonine-protein kinase [Gemmataceae bacterium]